MADSLFSLMFGISQGNYAAAEKCGRDEINGYTLDTCDTVDQGFETAIWKGDGHIIIVERYDNANDAREGHKKWCEFVKSSPKSVYSVQSDETEDF